MFKKLMEGAWLRRVAAMCAIYASLTNSARVGIWRNAFRSSVDSRQDDPGSNFLGSCFSLVERDGSGITNFMLALFAMLVAVAQVVSLATRRAHFGTKPCYRLVVQVILLRCPGHIAVLTAMVES